MKSGKQTNHTNLVPNTIKQLRLRTSMVSFLSVIRIYDFLQHDSPGCFGTTCSYAADRVHCIGSTRHANWTWNVHFV